MSALLAVALAAAPLSAAEPPCRGSTTIEGLLRKGWTPGSKLDDPLTSYFVCRALASRRADECAGLARARRRPSEDPGRRDKTLEQTCRMEYDEDLMVRAFLRGDADAVPLCARALREVRGRPLFKNGRLEPECADLAANWGDAALACARMKREFFGTPAQAGMDPCEPEIGVMMGEEASCPAGDWPDRVQHCRDFAAYRAARRAGSSAACGESGICRALMGDGPDACLAYERKVAEASCGIADLAAQARGLSAEQRKLAAGNGFLHGLELYARCRAAAAADVAPCESLRGIAPPPGRGGDLAEECRYDARDDALFRSIIDGNADLALCRSQKARHFKAGRAARACALVARDWRSPGKLADELAPLFGDVSGAEELSAWSGRFERRTGVEAACAAASFDDERLTCLEFAAYRRARAAGKAQLCGDLPICRAMMGGPADCESYAAQARAASHLLDSSGTQP